MRARVNVSNCDVDLGSTPEFAFHLYNEELWSLYDLMKTFPRDYWRPWLTCNKSYVDVSVPFYLTFKKSSVVFDSVFSDTNTARRKTNTRESLAGKISENDWSLMQRTLSKTLLLLKNLQHNYRHTIILKAWLTCNKS